MKNINNFDYINILNKTNLKFKKNKINNLMFQNKNNMMQLGGNADIDYNKSFIKSENIYMKKQYFFETVSLLRKALSRLNSNGIFLDKKLIEKIEKRLKDLETVENKLLFLAENMVDSYNYDNSIQGGRNNRVFDKEQLFKFNEDHNKIYMKRGDIMIKSLNKIFIKLIELDEKGNIEKFSNNIEKILKKSKEDIVKTKVESENTGINKIALGIGTSALALGTTAYAIKKNISSNEDIVKTKVESENTGINKIALDIGTSAYAIKKNISSNEDSFLTNSGTNARSIKSRSSVDFLNQYEASWYYDDEQGSHYTILSDNEHSFLPPMALYDDSNNKKLIDQWDLATIHGKNKENFNNDIDSDSEMENKLIESEDT